MTRGTPLIAAAIARPIRVTAGSGAQQGVTGQRSPTLLGARIMLIAGRSFTEPAGLLPSSGRRRCRGVRSQPQALQTYQRGAADDVLHRGVTTQGVLTRASLRRLR